MSKRYRLSVDESKEDLIIESKQSLWPLVQTGLLLGFFPALFFAGVYIMASSILGTSKLYSLAWFITVELLFAAWLILDKKWATDEERKKWAKLCRLEELPEPTKVMVIKEAEVSPAAAHRYFTNSTQRLLKVHHKAMLKEAKVKAVEARALKKAETEKASIMADTAKAGLLNNRLEEYKTEL